MAEKLLPACASVGRRWTESSLTKQLRELEADGFILRHDFCEVPPRVEYSLTELGESFLSVLDYMKDWGDANLSV